MKSKGPVRRAIELEKKRLENKKKGFWSVENDILQSYLLSLVLQLSLIYFFGWIMIPFLLIHNFWAWFVLTSANYIEHYGLLREKIQKGGMKDVSRIIHGIQILFSAT